MSRPLTKLMTALATWLVASAALAHGPGTALPWRFTSNPWVSGSILLGSAVYWRGRRAQAGKRRADASTRKLESSAFMLAMCTLAIALLSPLDGLSDVTFAAHMTQHELLMLLAAPLLVLGRPLPVYLAALPARARARTARWLTQPIAVQGFRALTAPLVALLLHGAVRWLWHLPQLFEAALRSEWIHGLQHATFFVSALLFWWGILQGRYGRAGYGVAALFVLATAIHTGALGALLSFSGHVWYPLYEARLRAHQLDPLGDQQLAGLIMWVAAFVWLLLLALALFLVWLGEARRRARRGSVAALMRRQVAP